MATQAQTMQVWWIPQVPGDPFTVLVANFVEAKLLLDTLANYNIFQFESNIKGVGGLSVFDPEDDYDGPKGSWVDWHPSEAEEAVLSHLLGDERAMANDVLTKMTIDEVRKFQKLIDA